MNHLIMEFFELNQSLAAVPNPVHKLIKLHFTIHFETIRTWLV